MELRIVLEVRRGGGFLFNLLDGPPEVGPGTSTDLGDGVVVTLTGSNIVKGLDAESTFTLVCTGIIALGSAADVARMIAHRITSRGPAAEDVVRMSIDEEETDFDEGVITRVIERHIDVERRRSGPPSR